jgi:hypothetical protein
MARWIIVLAVIALAVTVSVGVWAKTTPNQAGQHPQAAPAAPASPAAAVPLPRAIDMKQAGKETQASEHARCIATCQTVMPYYQQKYASLKTHDGAGQCWNNCWNQFGDRNRTNVTANDKKQLWQSKNAQYLRVNQCAQTCWGKYHKQQAAVQVVGKPSMPRPIVAGRMQATAQVFQGQSMKVAALPR